MTNGERRLLNDVLGKERDIAALAAEVSRLRAFLEAADVLFLESDRAKVVKLALRGGAK